MRNVVVRPALEVDWQAMSTLLRVCALPLEGAHEHLSAYFVAILDGAVVGTAGLEVYEDAALLRSVAVAPFRQGIGIGQVLVARVDAEARRRGIKALYLLTTTATAYFAKLGFSTETRERIPPALLASAEFRGACPSTAALMCRPVGQ